ncbi:predicted protein [Streptomyces viridosporus ATCC 14672]|uniref:Predicted protein n=1 Tax=Streptomyces viridosporus (strain ATCC 14672 / DSM 40746 / JCM 4963 / KCTC 9882 / NRRL B-12104 / FH 1290) TaxID=566461 RepID=D6A4F7_STRV1|nr:hypothetical protein [Streptomyces viridosporus]EFE65797.1 predicted protein [Streptomyces viridosporus ATCC 14672]
MAWRNEQVGGAGRTDDSRGPGPGRAWQSTGPGEHRFNGLTPHPSARQGEDVHLYRRARVTAS